jgi:hypothetical protein
LKNSNFKITNPTSIPIKNDGVLKIESIVIAVENVNTKFLQLKEKTSKMELNIFDVIDFRMISGLMGEALVTELSNNHKELEKNPNLDGYPDILNAFTSSHRLNIEQWIKSDLNKFIKYPHGGIEVKNTFGTKKANSKLTQGQTRIEKINQKLDWKAHHRYTNNLLALYSDYVDECPQISAVMFSDGLTEDDWKEKQNPGISSTMTSFSVIEQSGWKKLRMGMRLCKNDQKYFSFFGLEES